tara:strand:+ start:10566 stop:11459 length:894 start_codon:yes stop_codon:yes gene_type:complete
MKILSIDVGIKNLALFILETNNEKSNYNIIYWDVINLFEERNNFCQFIIESKNKKNSKQFNKQCDKLAKFNKNGCYYCKTHAVKSEFILPTSDLNKYKRMKLNELIKIKEEYNIPLISNNSNKNENIPSNENIPYNKLNLIKSIEDFVEKNVFENISETKCNEISVIDIGVSIKEKLDKLESSFFNIDVVLIENQISPIANRMNCIQGMLTQYFIMKNITNIQFISPSNKLKMFIGNKKTTYGERKKLSIEATKNILIDMECDNNEKDKVIDMFNKHKKKDDLADCFLQAIWYKESL